MGRHRVQGVTPSEGDPSGGGARPPIGALVPRLRAAVRGRLGGARERPKVVLTGAAAVVSLMALCGVVALARGFAPTANACSTSCGSVRSTAPADPRPSMPAATLTAHPRGSTLAPAVVRQEKRTPRATAPETAPALPPRMPGPQWHRHGWSGHGHGPGGW